MTIEFSTTIDSPSDPEREVEGVYVRGDQFDQTVGVSVPLEVGGGSTEDATILSIEAVLRGDEAEEITVTTDTDSITISGIYRSGWDDDFTYLDVGKSNKSEVPERTRIVESIPSGQDLFNLDQSTQDVIFREYDVTVVYLDQSNQQQSDTAVLTHEVSNSLEFIRLFMANYDYGEG